MREEAKIHSIVSYKIVCMHRVLIAATAISALLSLVAVLLFASLSFCLDSERRMFLQDRSDWFADGRFDSNLGLVWSRDDLFARSYYFFDAMYDERSIPDRFGTMPKWLVSSLCKEECMPVRISTIMDRDVERLHADSLDEWSMVNGVAAISGWPLKCVEYSRVSWGWPSASRRSRDFRENRESPSNIVDIQRYYSIDVVRMGLNVLAFWLTLFPLCYVLVHRFWRWRCAVQRTIGA